MLLVKAASITSNFGLSWFKLSLVGFEGGKNNSFDLNMLMLWCNSASQNIKKVSLYAY